MFGSVLTPQGKPLISGQSGELLMLLRRSFWFGLVIFYVLPNGLKLPTCYSITLPSSVTLNTGASTALAFKEYHCKYFISILYTSSSYLYYTIVILPQNVHALVLVL